VQGEVATSNTPAKAAKPPAPAAGPKVPELPSIGTKKETLGT
jgi:hypothetical protein